MAINLLTPPIASPFVRTGAAANPLLSQTQTPGSNQAPKGFTGPSSFSNFTQPLGVTAKTPAASTPTPPTVIPKAQQNPVSSPAPVAPVVSQTNNQSTQPAQTTNPTPSQPATPTFSGLLGQAVNQQNSPYNQAARASIYGTQGASQNTYGQGAGIANQTSQEAIDAAQRLQELQNAVATGKYNIETTPMLGQFQQGREQALQNMYGGQEQALANEITGLGGLYSTAVGQQGTGITGLNAAGQTALTGQGQVQGALQSAAGLAQPNTVSQGQAVFNPVTGQFTGGGQFDVTTNANNFANNVLNGTMTYDQAVQSLGYTSVGKAALDQAITAAGGNPLQLQASGSATQGIIQQQQGQAAGYQSALQQGQNLQSQLSDLITTFGLNPSDLNAANAGIQKIAQNTSDPHYKILQNYVNDVANTYAQVLTPPGGSQTDTSRGIAASMLDATASGKSLLQVMQSLDQAAKAKIAGIPTTGAATSNTSTNSSTGNTGGGTVQTKYGAINTGW